MKTKPKCNNLQWSVPEPICTNIRHCVFNRTTTETNDVLDLSKIQICMYAISIHPNKTSIRFRKFAPCSMDISLHFYLSQLPILTFRRCGVWAFQVPLYNFIDKLKLIWDGNAGPKSFQMFLLNKLMQITNLAPTYPQQIFSPSTVKI